MRFIREIRSPLLIRGRQGVKNFRPLAGARLSSFRIVPKRPFKMRLKNLNVDPSSNDYPLASSLGQRYHTEQNVSGADIFMGTPPRLIYGTLERFTCVRT